jgi:hypothetical protein
VRSPPVRWGQWNTAVRDEFPAKQFSQMNWRQPMNTPKTDDFRLERRDDGLAVVFTPTGQTYTFAVTDGGKLSEPTVSPAQTNAGDYADGDIRKTATELARLAVSGSPRT